MNKTELRAGVRFTIDNESIFSRTLEDETVILNLQTGQYFSTEHIGTRIWDLLMQDKDFSEIKTTLLQEFEADEDLVENDLIEFVTELESRGLLQRKN